MSCWLMGEPTRRENNSGYEDMKLNSVKFEDGGILKEMYKSQQAGQNILLRFFG